MEVLLYAFDLGRELPDVAFGLAPELRALTEDDVGPYLKLRTDEHADAVRERLRRGDVCIAAWSGERVVGTAWVRFDRIWVSELGRSLLVRPGESYGYAAFIEPEHRGRGTARALYVATLRYVKSLGYRRVLVYVAGENLAGRAPLWRLGFEYVGRIRWFHVGPVGVELMTEPGKRPRARVHVRRRASKE